MDAIYSTNLENIPLAGRGKVRDMYDLGDTLLIVATDRLSAFDVVFPTPIPWKGIVLTQLSLFWFNKTEQIVKNHLITGEVAEYPQELSPYKDMLRGRSMLVRKARPLEVECVVRGYLDGSAWREYRSTGRVCGIKLPEGLRQRDKLTEPLFTPATKATSGHDENITHSQAAEILGDETFEQVKTISIAIYKFAHNYLEERGLILSDTKFEFGIAGDELILIDECLTPDSSRFWQKEGYHPGGESISLDKQYVRDYVEEIGWDKSPPAPALPEDVIAQTTERYLTAYKIITGNDLKEKFTF
ncbi:phosphoribosylaminoimidazolesuccinocarboxamide synthase [Candidatus Sumerlaeota bacterium]|nr:phosphoribosylaminoimidazolesuccinocarboxamide synthase [Candidatus Sumerlaeota bacterium]